LEIFSKEKVIFKRKTFFLKNIHLAKWKEFATKKWCLVMFLKEFFSYDQIGDYLQENVGK